MPSRLFPLIRPVYEDEPELELAIAEARNNAELSEALERQIAFDDEIVAQLRSLALDDARIEKLERSLAEETAQPIPPTLIIPPPSAGQGPGAIGAIIAARPTEEPRTRLPDPPKSEGKAEQEEKPEEEEEEQPRARLPTIFFAIGVGLIATLCLVGYIVWDQMNSFQGVDRIIELLDSANGLTGDEFEAVQTSTDSLKDWFLLKNEHFDVPKEFGSSRTIACRVFQFHNVDVGEVMAKEDRELLYFLFNPADLGVKLKTGKWNVVEGERLVGGVTRIENTGFIVAFRGKHDEMQSYLAKKVPGNQ
jgi:hypothetical protein